MMENESEESVCHFCDKCSATFDNAMALSRHKVQNHFHQTLQASNRFKGGRSQQNYSNNELFQKCGRLISNDLPMTAAEHRRQIQRRISQLKRNIEDTKRREREEYARHCRLQMQMKRNGGGEFLTLTLNDDDVCVTDVSDDESLHLDNDVEEMVEVAPDLFLDIDMEEEEVPAPPPPPPAPPSNKGSNSVEEISDNSDIEEVEVVEEVSSSSSSESEDDELQKNDDENDDENDEDDLIDSSDDDLELDSGDDPDDVATKKVNLVIREEDSSDDELPRSDPIHAPFVEPSSGLSCDDSKTNEKVETSTQNNLDKNKKDHVPEAAENSKKSLESVPERETVIAEKSKRSPQKDEKSSGDIPVDNINKSTPAKARGRKKSTTKSKLKTIEVGDDAVCMIVDVVDVCASKLLSASAKPKDIAENIDSVTSTAASNTEKITPNRTKETACIETPNAEKVEKSTKRKRKNTSKQDKRCRKKNNKEPEKVVIKKQPKPDKDDAANLGEIEDEEFDDILALRSDEEHKVEDNLHGSEQQKSPTRRGSRSRPWLNAFTVWSTKAKQEMIDETVGEKLSSIEISKRLREKWRALTRVQRNAFHQEAEKVEKKGQSIVVLEKRILSVTKVPKKSAAPVPLSLSKMGLRFAKAEKDLAVEQDCVDLVPESDSVVPKSSINQKQLLTGIASNEKSKVNLSKVPENSDSVTSSPVLSTRICCKFCENKFFSDVDYVAHANKVHRRYVLKSWKRCEHCTTYLPDETLLSRHKFRNHFHQIHSLRRTGNSYYNYNRWITPNK